MRLTLFMLTTLLGFTSAAVNLRHTESEECILRVVKQEKEYIFECEMDRSDVNCETGVTRRIDASPEQIASLRAMLDSGELVPGKTGLAHGPGAEFDDEYIFLRTDLSVATSLRGTTRDRARLRTCPASSDECFEFGLTVKKNGVEIDPNRGIPRSTLDICLEFTGEQACKLNTYPPCFWENQSCISVPDSYFNHLRRNQCNDYKGIGINRGRDPCPWVTVARKCNNKRRNCFWNISDSKCETSCIWNELDKICEAKLMFHTTTGPTSSPTTGPTSSPTTGPTSSPTTGPTSSPTPDRCSKSGRTFNRRRQKCNADSSCAWNSTTRTCVGGGKSWNPNPDCLWYGEPYCKENQYCIWNIFDSVCEAKPM